MNAELIVLIIITSISADKIERVYVREGGAVNLTCIVKSTEVVTWLVPPNLNIYVVGDATQAERYPNLMLQQNGNAERNILQILNFSRINEGSYRCQTPLMDYNYEIIIHDTILIETKIVHGTIGSDVELICTIKPRKGTISWLGPMNDSLYAVGNEVNTNKKSFTEVIVSDHSKLKIKGLSTEKEGLYTCFFNTTEEKFEIKIKKNPSNLRVVNETNKGMIYGVEGADLSLECTVNRGEPGGNISWTDEDHVYAVNGPEHVYYRFRPGRSDHNKVFKCTAYNSEGETVESHNVKLFIFYKPEVNISPQPSRVLREGQDLKLNCRHDGNDPDAWIEWTKNGTKRPLNDNTLKFKGVKRQEAGEYTCEVHTKGGHGDSSIFIEIQYPPNVTIKKRQPDNNTSILECIANGVPNKYLFSKWEHKTEWFDHVRFIEGTNNGYLTIQNDPSNEYGYYQNSGIYVCNVSNNISDSSGSIHQSAAIDFRLKGRPFFLSGNKQKQYAIYGREGVIQLFLYSNPKYESLTMFCGKKSFRLQSDNTKEKYYLAENEGPILDNIHGSLVNVSAYNISVRINKITQSDFRSYTINATNSWGTAAFTVRLISAQRPEPPFNVSAKPDTNIIRVYWNGGFDGGYSQTFVLQYKKLGVSLQNEWTRFGEINDARKETYSTAIEGLEFDKQYIVCIFAYNEMNSSEIKCTDPVKTDLEKEARTQMTQYSIITLVMIMLGIVFSFQIGILILKGLKRKICKTRRQDSIQLGPQHASEMNPQSHYDEIGSVYYGPVATQGAINTREAQPENNNSPTRSTKLAGLNESINTPGHNHRISNVAQSTDSDDSYLVPCISQSQEDSNNQAESYDGSSVSSDNSETILKNDRRYENLNCVYITEHPYMPCPQLKANTQRDVQH